MMMATMMMTMAMIKGRDGYTDITAINQSDDDNDDNDNDDNDNDDADDDGNDLVGGRHTGMTRVAR